MTRKTVKVIQSELIEGLNKITVKVGELGMDQYVLKVVDDKALNYAEIFIKQ